MSGLCSRYLFFEEISQGTYLRPELFELRQFLQKYHVEAIIRAFHTDRPVLPAPSRKLTMAHLDKILADKQHYVHVLLDRMYNPSQLPPNEVLTSWHLENALEALPPRIDALKPTEFEVDKS